jgi:hypothetical protein
MVVAVYNKLWSSEEELLAESRFFVAYMQTLPLVSQWLMYQIRFVPGGEHILWECLHENRKLHAASDGSLDLDAELASHGWHLSRNGNVLIQGAGPVDGVPEFISLHYA